MRRSRPATRSSRSLPCPSPGPSPPPPSSLCVLCPARADDKPAYRVLAADKGHVAIVNAKGEVEWEVPDRHEVHDLALLPDGNVLLPIAPPPSSR